MSDKEISLGSFLRAVVAPILLAFLVTVGSLAGFIKSSIDQTDATALAQQSDLLRLAIDERIRVATHMQLDLAVWDGPLQAYARNDTEWFVRNFIEGNFDDYAHGQIHILGPDLTPFFAARDSQELPPAAFETVRQQMLPLIERLGAPQEQAAIAAFKIGNRPAPSIITDIAIIDGQPALVGATVLLSDTHELNIAPGNDPIFIAFTNLDAAFARALSSQYLLNGARFDTDASLAPGETAIALNNAAGEPTVWIKWIPDSPGERVLSNTLPALVGAVLVSTAIIVLLLRNLRRVGKQLHSERIDAQHRALHDPLTGLGNRTLFRDRLDQAFQALPRTASSFALLALDLDRFKQINDTLGHEAGDELLRQVAGRITNILRPTDTLVRLGGDEFAILQTSIAGPSDAATLAKRVLGALSAPFQLEDRTVQIGVSIGIATAPENASLQSELQKRADEALYQAKAGGRNQFCFYAGNKAVTVTPASLSPRLDGVANPGLA